MEKKVFLIIFIAVLTLYYPVLGTYFTGDDFFHFKAALSTESLFARDYAFFRPIFREFLYSAFYNLFGLNQLPFRILQFGLHFGNIFLVYKLTGKLFENKFVSFFAAFFFGISAANVGALYYLAGGIQAQGATLFTLLSLLTFSNKRRVLSFLLFVLAISSHELTLTMPIVLSGIKKSVLTLWPYFFVIAIFLYLNLFIIGLPKGEVQYSPSLNLKTMANTLSWYGVWAMGLPEMLVDFVRPGLGLNPNLMKFWGGYFRIIFPAFFVSLGVLGTTTVYMLIKKQDILMNRKLLFLIFWFVVGLFPVLFLPIHKKTYYLQPVLPAFWTIVGYLTYKIYKSYKILAALLILSLFVLSVASIKLGEKTYWATQRGKISQKILFDIKNLYPLLPKGANIYVKNDPDYPFIAKEWGGTSNQAFLALSGSDALQLVYNDPTLKVYYEDRESRPKDEIFEFTAKIPH